SPTRSQQEKLTEIDNQLQAARVRVRSLEGRLKEEQAEWENGDAHSWTGPPPMTVEGLLARFVPHHPDKARFVQGKPAFAKGKVGNAIQLDARRYLDGGDVGAFGFYDRFSLAAWVRPEGSSGGTIVSRMTDEPQGDGYAVVLV